MGKSSGVRTTVSVCFVRSSVRGPPKVYTVTTFAKKRVFRCRKSLFNSSAVWFPRLPESARQLLEYR
eukprot:scaffold1963_cov242-Pinguiococcus_pyrenoidosus.AAC.2